MKNDSEKSNIFQHFLLTHFNLPHLFTANGWSGPSIAWQKHRFKLFDQFCYPSVRVQSNQNFKWLVVFDENTPGVFIHKIKKYSEWDNFVPIYLRIDKPTANNYLKPHEIADKIFQIKISDYLQEETKYVITTILDNDDMFCREYIQMIQSYFDKQNFQFLNFNNGYVWNYNTYELYKVNIHSNTYMTLVENFDSFKTIRGFGVSHKQFCEIGPYKEIMTKPMWVQGVHGKNVSNKIKGKLLPHKEFKLFFNDFLFKRNLLLVYTKASFFYYMKLILANTRELRFSLGLTWSQLIQRKNKFTKLFERNNP